LDLAVFALERRVPAVSKTNLLTTAGKGNEDILTWLKKKRDWMDASLPRERSKTLEAIAAAAARLPVTLTLPGSHSGSGADLEALEKKVADQLTADPKNNEL